MRAEIAMPKTPGVGVGIIITKDEQVLSLRRKDVHGAGSWSTPGGHLEFSVDKETRFLGKNLVSHPRSCVFCEICYNCCYYSTTIIPSSLS